MGFNSAFKGLTSELNSIRRSCFPPYPCSWRLIEPQKLSEYVGEEINIFPLHRIEPRLLGCQAPVPVIVR